MDRKTFIDILMTFTPEELNEYIAQKGKERKFVNGITIVEEDQKNEIDEY